MSIGVGIMVWVLALNSGSTLMVALPGCVVWVSTIMVWVWDEYKCGNHGMGVGAELGFDADGRVAWAWVGV